MTNEHIEKLQSLVHSRKPDITLWAEENHWYKVAGSKHWIPSVTTMLGSVMNKGYGFEKWLGDMPSYKIACEERDLAGAIGTLVHKHCETLMSQRLFGLQLEDCEYGDKVWKRMMSFVEWFKEYKPNVITLEERLAHMDVPWAGTPDIVCVINGKLCLIDIKTGGAYPTHGLQLTCYKKLWDMIFPEYPIEEMYGLYLKDSWRTKILPLMKSYDYAPEVADSVKHIWHWMNGKSAQPKKKFPIKTSFKLPDFNSNMLEQL